MLIAASALPCRIAIRSSREIAIAVVESTACKVAERPSLANRARTPTIAPCPTCASFERAYVHHLVRSDEILSPMLMTEHNLWFYQRLMQAMRDAIAEARLAAFAGEFLSRYSR